MENSHYDLGFNNTTYEIIRNLTRHGDIAHAWDFLEKAFSAKVKHNPTLTEWQTVPVFFQFNNVIPWENRVDWQIFLEGKIKKSPTLLTYRILADIYRSSDQQNYQTKGLVLWESAVREYPNDPEPMIQLADIYASNQSKVKDAIGLYQKALEIKEKRKDKDVNIYYSQLISLYGQQGNIDDAMALVKRIEKQEPIKESMALWASIGNAYKQRKQWEKAIEAYQKSLAFEGNINTSVSIIQCYLELHQYDAAETTAINLIPPGSQGYHIRQVCDALLRVYDAKQMYEKELDYYFLMLKANPQEYKLSAIDYSLIEINSDKERVRKLVDVLEKRVEKNPKDWLSQGILAELYFWLGDVPAKDNSLSSSK